MRFIIKALRALLSRRVLPLALAVGAIIAAPTLSGGEARAETWFADIARPDDSGDGLSWGTAKKTIGAAITASTAGDTILVKYGIYPVGDALVLTSNRRLGSDDGTHTTWDGALPDSSQCIVSADATCRVVTISGTAVTAATVVRGFTLTGGDATNEGDPYYGYGGGLDISGGADPIVERCRMTGNLAGHYYNGDGGGVSVRGSGSSPEIRYCRIDGNTGSSAWFTYGGGLYIGGGPVSVHHCAIVSNKGSTARVGSGGGVAGYGGSGEIADCEIAFNIASPLSTGVGGSGGGIYTYASTLVVRRCEITDNTAAEANGYGGAGGGIYLMGSGGIQVLDCYIARNVCGVRGGGTGGGIRTGSGQIIRGNVIEDNRAAATEGVYVGYGGGVFLADSNTNLSGNLIKGNTASLHGDGYGGGIYFESNNTIERNVIWGNVASNAAAGYGGGIYTGGGAGSSLRNNTVVRNANTLNALGGGGGSGFYEGASGNPTVQNNIFCDHDVAGSDGIGIYSGAAMTVSYNCFDNNTGGNYSALVVSQYDQLGDPRFTDPDGGDFTLQYDSPCIETGNPATAVPANGGWRVDIGAFEYTGTRHWRAIAGTGEYLFGGRVKAKVNVVDAGTLSSIDMFVYPGEEHPLAPGSVERYYTIDATGEDALFDLTLSYLDEELGGADEDSLGMWRWQGFAWEGPKPPIARDTAANWLTVGGQTAFSDWVIAEVLDLTAVPEDPASAPGCLALAPNYPNPFSVETRIAYLLPSASHVRLAVFDVGGRLVRVLVDGEQAAGEHWYTWDGRTSEGCELSRGLYFCELRAGGERQVRKLLLCR